MPGSEQPHVDYYFRKERLSDDGGERAHARIVGALPEDRYVEPEDFLESLLKGEPWAVGGVERRKRVKRHDRLADHLAANPDLLEPGLTLRGKEIAVSSTSGEGGSVDLLFLDGAGRFLIVEVKVKPEELDKAVGQLRRHARLYIETFHTEAARLRLAVACFYIPPSRIAEFAEIGITCFSLPGNLLDTV